MAVRLDEMAVTGILLAAGRGLRAGGGEPKQFRRLNGKELFRHSLDCLLEHPRIRDVVLVVPGDWVSRIRRMPAGAQSGRLTVIAGGETRRESARAGLASLHPGCTHVLIHDAARPWIKPPLLDRILDGLTTADAVIPVIDVTDTLVRLDSSGNAGDFPDRQGFRRVQTPQGFRLEIIRDAHDRADKRTDIKATDDAGLVHHFKLAPVALVAGDSQNVKITRKEDLAADQSGVS